MGHQSIDKRRVYLPKCLLAWDKITRPLQFGGLIPNLQVMGWSLRIRWLWLEKNDAHRPWAGLPIPVSKKEKAFLHMAVETIVTRNRVDAVFRYLQSASQIVGRGYHGSSSRTLGNRCTNADGNNDSCSFVIEEDHAGWSRVARIGARLRR
jgi:hypothetical protein